MTARMVVPPREHWYAVCIDFSAAVPVQFVHLGAHHGRQAMLDAKPVMPTNLCPMLYVDHAQLRGIADSLMCAMGNNSLAELKQALKEPTYIRIERGYQP